MKKLSVIFLVVVLFTSCSIYKYPYTQSTSYIDYSYLFDKGLFVTESNSVNFDYSPMGSVYIEVRSGYGQDNSKKNRPTNQMYDGIYHSVEKSVMKDYIVANVEDALDLLHKKASDVGANGIINLKITYLSEEGATQNYIRKGPGYAISGMVIKIYDDKN
jgi:hypothetical protein